MVNRARHGTAAGFSLVEVLVALALLTTGVVAAARLLASSSAANARSKAITYATVLAADKMEQLRASAIDEPALVRSPPGALVADVDGFHDRPDAAFVRRWSVEPLPSYADDAVAVRVFVELPGSAGKALLETIKVRKPRRPVM